MPQLDVFIFFSLACQVLLYTGIFWGYCWYVAKLVKFLSSSVLLMVNDLVKYNYLNVLYLYSTNILIILVAGDLVGFLLSRIFILSRLTTQA